MRMRGAKKSRGKRSEGKGVQIRIRGRVIFSNENLLFYPLENCQNIPEIENCRGLGQRVAPRISKKKSCHGNVWNFEAVTLT